MDRVLGPVAKSWRLLAARVFLASALSGIISIAGSATLTTDNIKITPREVQSESSPNLPPEVQSLESQTAPRAFDRDTASDFTAFEGGHLVAILDVLTEVRGIKIYGPAPYTLSVEADVNGAWQAVAGLQSLNLATLPTSWNSFQATAPVTTARLRFGLTLAAGGSTTGVKGIEIWGNGGRVNVRNGTALLAALLGASPPVHARLYTAAPQQGVIGATTGGVDDASDNTFRFTLDRDPLDFKNVYLGFQVLGLSHWVHAVRSINGAPAQGGFVLPVQDTWSTQIEEIDSLWLRRGVNEISFSPSTGATGTYTIKDVYLVGELESGANFVATVGDNQFIDTNPPGSVLDGDSATGWTPYPGANVFKAHAPVLTFSFNKKTQVEGLAFNLINSLKGSVDVEFLKDGTWSPSGAATQDARKFVTGWNTVTSPSNGGVDGLRLVFTGGKGSSAQIQEVVLSGSGEGPTFNPPQISISFPDSGQFYGRTAYIRGFLQPLDNGSGAAIITVGPQAVTSTDGAFGVTLTKDDVGLTAQGDREAWSVEVKAIYPDGQTVAKTVVLGSSQAALESTVGNLLPTYNVAVPPGQLKKIGYDAAALEIDPNALLSETTIGITPLSDDDLPALDAGMTNVTKGPRKGYRFTPHPMKFKSKIKVTLPYQKAKIPPGHTEQDVKTFYFDDQSGSWKELERVAIDATANTVTSLTDHFTDMINATVTVPDHPQTTSFNPTQIKDIKAADPGAQINLIDSPQVNNMGDARLSYPIEVPPGRHGLQPQMAVQYNSSGGNGWMGMGWDVPMQAVTIDTRWGVPRYDAGLETETYMLSGEQLTPVAHRGDLVSRTPDKVFHARVEGQFRRIVRRGTNPSNYTWEVTDKNGVRYLYGATDPATETLTDAAGNIFLWALCEIRDPNGNFVRYRYTKVSDTGVAGGSVAGTNIYLQRITYTGNGLIEGPYVVSLVRDRNLGEARRTDVQINARGGFKRVTADLLRRIDVSLNNQLIRRYVFGYNENPYGDNRSGTAFNKTLLTSISQFADDGLTLFNKHTLTYFDEARDSAGSYNGFSPTADWAVGNDGVTAGLLGRGAASAIGGSQSIGAGGHLYVGVGTGADVTSKNNTAGVKVGFSQSSSESLIAMADMNGDALPDKVFRGGGGFSYRPNLSGPIGTPSFGAPVPLPTLPAISRERVTSTTAGVETYLGLPVMVDANRATTEADTYFSDVNGDGLTDLVSGGQVLFGFINAAGVPTFSANSADTPVLIGTGAIDATNLLEDASAVEAERAQQFPLLDTLRRWVAPYDGVVMINAPVRLIQDTSPERAQHTGADGVRVAIQLEGSELWFDTIVADDFVPHLPTAVNAVPVRRGDRLYFRVQSVFDGAFDQVAWDPEITYTGSGIDTARTDVNDLPEYVYRASGDFTLAGRGGATVTLPLGGTLRLAGTFEKTGVTTDDVTLVVSKNGMEVFSRTIGFAETATVPISKDILVEQLDVLEWRVFIDSPIDATRVRLVPNAFYTAADGVDTVKDDQNNFVVKVDPPFAMDLYPVGTATMPQDFFTVPATGMVPVQARLQIAGLPAETPTSAVFTVKRRGALLAKRLIDIPADGEFTVMADVQANAGDELFFDLSSRDPFFASRVTLFEVTANGAVVPSAIHTPAVEELFPQPYRGWGAAGYNGNPPRDAQPINQALLVVNQNFDPNNVRAYPFFPRPADALWGGVDEFAWVKADSASSSRLGLDDIRVVRSDQFAGAAAPSRISRSDNLSVSVIVGASAGSSQSQLEFQDLNGDRFPDVISRTGGVQFSRAVGGLESGRRGTGPGSARESSNESLNISTSGAGNMARAIADARGGVSPFGVRPAQTADQGSDMVRLGFGGNVGTGTSETEFDLIDVNGDGLPDKVFKNGTASLNLGYSFAPAEPWGGGIVNDGQTQNAGVNLGFNLNFYSIAGGLNLGIGTTRSDENYVDVNGDGLPDKIVSGSPFTVRLNTGSGFAGPIDWPGGHGKVAVDNNISLGGGVFFTFGFTFLGAVKVVINPGVHASTSMGRPEVSFRDLDGDGYTDHVFSERDSQLQVALNPIGRTNLLKHIDRPLGATFDLEYTRSGNTFDQPQNRWVMTKATVFDGVPGDHQGNGADFQVMKYTYENGQWDRFEREFYGYQNVTETQLDTTGLNATNLNSATPYRRITREYLNSNVYNKGLLARDLTEDVQGGLNRPFLKALNTYLLRDIVTRNEVTPTALATATVFPELTRSERRFFEGQAIFQKFTFTTHEYDALGNVARFADAGDVGAADDVEVLINYTSSDPACQATYIVGKANAIDVIGNGTLMRKRAAMINCASGNLEQVRQFLETDQQAVSDLTYLPNGNLQSVTGPLNKNNERYALTYVYDPVVDTHVTSITDSFGYTSTATYNFKYGTPELTTDINGQQTNFVYDSVGRVDTIAGPYELPLGLITIDFDYHPEASVPFAFTTHIDKDAAGALTPTGTIDTILFTDGLKRVLQTKKDASLHTTPEGISQTAMIVSGRVIFDHVSRTIEQFYPVSEAKGTNTAFNTTFDSVQPTRMAYDVLDRNTRTTIPDNTSTTIQYGFGSDRSGATQFEVLVTDANAQQQNTFRDVRQLITAVQEFNAKGNQPVLWTSYVYDPLKQITRVIDDKSNATNIAYDNFGRRTVIDNPDLGKTETVYDLASNVTQKKTANLRPAAQAIEYDYRFNRLQGIRYPSFVGNNVIYTYGEPGDLNRGANRVIKVTSEAGIEERRYGLLGEMESQTWTIASDTQGNSANSPEVYKTLYQYDTWNRLLRMTYPDGEVLTYTYDSGGLLDSAQGVKASFTYDYIKRLEYDQFEQRTFVTLGNNVRTQYTYDPLDRRLATLSSGKGAGNSFQNLLYTYDDVGNILSLANDVAVSPPSQFGGPTSQHFVYDDLYRLTSANGSYQFSPNKSHQYTLAMSYDSIHNIAAKQQAHTIVQPSGTPITQKKTSYVFNYAYNPSGAGSVRPHAPTHIGDRTYSYDANGNQLGWDHDQNGTRRNIVWDEENRIQSVFDNGHEKTYKYDDQGQRVIKRGPQGETVYVNQYFTIRNREGGTKHVFAGTTRMVSKLMKQDKPGANPKGKSPVEKDLYFFHADHLGSTGYVTDTTGKLFQHIEYFPFGETWVEEASNTQRTPYLFTGKELDEETGLYYFGARYYDPRTSVWQSGDPILDKYLPIGEKASALSGMGGVYHPINLGLYSYGHQNPIKFTDPDGNIVFIPVILGALWVADKAYAAYEAYQDVQAIQNGEKTVGEVAKERAAEQAAGVAFGAVGRLGVKAGKALLRHSDEVVDLAKKATPTNGVDLKLKHKSDWTEAQRQAACEKCQALTNADTVVTRNVNRSGTSAADRYKRAGGDIPKGNDVDHVQDLQLGGADDILNMNPLDMSVNRSLGAQIQQRIKDLPEGTRINSITIE